MKKVVKKVWFIPLFICAMMSCFALTSCGDDEPDEPKPTVVTGNPDNPGDHNDNSITAIENSDFIGKWYHPSGAYVFDLKSGGIGDMYILKSWKGEIFSEKGMCSWEYIADSKTLKILTFKGKIEETVAKTNFPDDFTTNDGKWSACSTLPKAESNNDSDDSNEDDHKYANYFTEYYGSGKKCCEIEIVDLVMGTELYAGGGNYHIKYIRLFDKDGKGIFSLEKHYDGATIPSNDKWDPGTYQILESTPNIYLHNPIIITRSHKALETVLGTVKIQYVGRQIIFEFQGTHSYNEYERVNVYFKGNFSK